MKISRSTRLFVKGIDKVGLIGWLPIYIYELCMYAQLLSHVWLFATSWTIAHQASLSGILQARILEQVATSSSRGSS